MVGAALAVLTGQAASTARSAASIQEGPLLNHDSALRGRQEKCRRLRSFNAGVGPNLCAADDDVFCVQLSLTSETTLLQHGGGGASTPVLGPPMPMPACLRDDTQSTLQRRASLSTRKESSHLKHLSRCCSCSWEPVRFKRTREGEDPRPSMGLARRRNSPSVVQSSSWVPVQTGSVRGRVKSRVAKGVAKWVEWKANLS